MVPESFEMSRTSVVQGILDISKDPGKGSPRAVKMVSAGSAQRPLSSEKVYSIACNFQLSYSELPFLSEHLYGMTGTDCKNLQNVVATTCIFILQQPTF